MAALALIAAPGAKADVEEFTLSGNYETFTSSFPFFSLVPFSGTMQLDFSNNFASETVTSISINVGGHVFDQTPPPHMLGFASSNLAVIDASNSLGDMLSLQFATAGPPTEPATLADFDTGKFEGGDVIFGDLSGALFDATGDITRVFGPPIPDPPPVTPTTVPELSTWAMMLVGLAGLGFAARRRRALGSLGGRP